MLKIINETLKYALGDATVKIIYDYLKRKSCPIYEIPRKPEVFSSELRMILQSNSGLRFHSSLSALGTVSILERTIVKRLCSKLGVEFNEEGPIVFEDWIKRLREVYYHGKSGNC
ncbi:hypothetical protein DRO50_01490 [Candidatus Bathyarchaeota archaeon]|nr:MAG: hypothetical protein DRO50_01490 [Candidatus Bathyarchaeota archaeon]